MNEERKVIPPDDTCQRGQSAEQTSQNLTVAQQVAQQIQQTGAQQSNPPNAGK